MYITVKKIYITLTAWSMNICIIGAGFSGICAGAQLKKQLNAECRFTIFDQNKDFGGVWLANTYPGCACDIPSHLYSFSFEPNSYWSKLYCEQEEILQYLKNVAHKYDLYSHTKFNHRVLELKWDENIFKWKISVRNNVTGVDQELLFDIVINGQGRFHEPKTPDEFLTFNGPSTHTAKWDNNTEFEGKTVAVIGSGASGAQIIPSIARKVKRLLVYQRHAPWVVPRSQFKFPRFVKWSFENIPGLRWAFRNCIYLLHEINFSGFRLNTLGSRVAPLLAKFHLWKQVKGLSIRQQLTPNYKFGCKRVIPSSDFYPSFNIPNVELISSKIAEVTNDSIITEDGRHDAVDLIILATGFRVHDHFGSINIWGRNGEDLLPSWMKDKPKAYLGIMNSITPNLFLLLGPNTGTGYTTVIFSLECQVNWIIKVIQEMSSRRSRYVRVKCSTEDAYMMEIHEKLKYTIYASNDCENCGSWYRNSTTGTVVEIYPNTTLSYWKLTRNINPSDFEFQ